MARVQMAVVERYMELVDGLSETARAALENVIMSTDLRNPGSRWEIADLLAGALNVSVLEASELATIFYGGMRERYYNGTAEYVAEPFTSFVEESARRIIDGMLSKVGEIYTEEQLADDLGQMVDREMKVGAAETIIGNAQADPAKPRYARVPTGAETCAFCMMLASRGFEYHSRETAGEMEKYHAFCDCAIVPEFDADGVDGYEPDDYYALYMAARKNTADDSEAYRAWEAMTDEERARYKGFSDYYTKLVLHTMREQYGLK